MRKIRCIRILVRLLVYGLIGVSGLLVTSIWWLPLALPTFLRWGDVEVRAVERLDSGRLRLTEVDYATDSVRCSVGTLEVPSLHQYLWERFGASFSEASLIEADALVIQLLATESEPTESGQSDVVSIVRRVRATLAAYGQWVPPLKLGELAIRSSDGESLFAAHAVSLRDWQLVAMVEHARLPEAVEVRASLDPEAEWSAHLAAKNAGIDLDLLLDTASQGVDVSFELRRAAESAAGVVSFTEGNWLPVRATLKSERLSVDSKWLPPLESLQLEGAALSGIDLRWEDGRYTGVLAIEGAVVASEQPSVPLDGALEFSGDLERLRVDVLQLAADWGQLRLRQPLDIDLKDGSVTERAEFQAEVDLSKQSFLPAGGRVEASMSVAPSLTAGPNVRFKLSATDLIYDRYQVAQVDLSGRLEGSALTVDQMMVQPLGSDVGRVELSGRADLSTQDLDFKYNVSLAYDWINTMIAPVALSDALTTSGRISGRFEIPTIEGSLEPLTVESPGVTPITVSGTYRSDGWKQWSVVGAATAAGAVIDASFVTRLADGSVAVDLNRFVWADPVRPTLELQAPTRFSYQYSGVVDFPESRMVVERFRLAGPELEIEAGWNPSTGLELRLSNVTLQRLGRWVDRELPSLTIESVELSVSELRPCLIGSIGVHVESQAAGDAVPLRVDLAAQLTTAGVTADPLQLKFADTPLLQGAISVPMTFLIPTEGESFWKLLEAGALSGELHGSVNPALSDWLMQNTGVKVKEATVDLNVKGSLQNPIGQLDLKVASLETSIAGIPSIDRIELVAKGEPDTIQIERFDFLINQSQVSGALSLPVDGFIEALRGDMDRRKAWLAKGAGRIELVDWRAEDWVDYLPAIIRRSGRLSGSLELKPDWDLSGSLSFKEFALRPTDSLPSVDLIGGRIDLSNRKFTVQDASAQVGGSPVKVAGWLDASDFESPLWEFAVSGLNVPLVRTTDMILRSDLDVKASHTSRSETPLISGALNLRSSTMLVEFDPLAPNVETGPRSQPPFFSITEPSIADWRFDLKVAGDSFMRVRSPYFRTQLSANFDLGGTFAEPLLIGSVRTVDGELRFPGAKMRIASGEAYIEPGQPNVVQLNFSGIAQKTSYIITMDVSQTLDDPLIQFQSTPALSNAAIVRLLTTGSTTGGGVGTVGLYLGQGLLGAGGMDEKFTDRLTVDVGEETSRTGRNTVGVRYDLSEDLFLEGGYDVYDAYNMDLIWSIFKR